MESFYRIKFSANEYLTWAHGEFYISHRRAYAMLFTENTLKDVELNEFLHQINETYELEHVQNINEIKQQFIYESW